MRNGSTILNADHFGVALKVEIKNSTGSWVDFSNLGGGDWVLDAEVSKNIDAPVPQASASIWREQDGGGSVAPGKNSYIDIGREIRFKAAPMKSGATSPTTSLYQTIFHGRIQEYDEASNPMRIVARGLEGRLLATRWVEDENEYGGGSMKSTIQSIFTDFTVSADTTGGVALTNADPSFTIEPYRQQKMSVLDAANQVASLAGHIIEPDRWSDASSAFRTELRQPVRSSTQATQYTFEPKDYLQVERLAVSELDVRNAVKVTFFGSTGKQSVTRTSTASIAKYGRQYMEFQFGKGHSIDTTSEAQTLGDYALDDLKEPTANFDVMVPYFPRVQLFDYYAFNGPTAHWTSNQKFGVVGWRHRFNQGSAFTYLKTRGLPAGFNDVWKKIEGQRDRDRPLPQYSVFPSLSTADNLEAVADGNEWAASLKILARKGSSLFVASTDLTAETAIDGQNLTGIVVKDVDTGSQMAVASGDIVNISWRGFSEAGGGGRQSEINRLTLTAEELGLGGGWSWAVYPSQSTGGIGTLTAKILEDPEGTLNVMRYATHIGKGDWDFSDPTDNSVWTTDPSTAYTTTVAISGKQNSQIMWAAGRQVGGSTTVVYELKGHTFDADLDAEITNLGIGYDDSGFALINAVADEDAFGIIGTIVADSTSVAPTPAEGATVNLTSASTAGTIGLDGNFLGWLRGDWGYITDGTQGDVFYVRGNGSSASLPVDNPSSLPAYASGTPVTRIPQPAGSDSLFGIRARQGTAKMDANLTTVGPENDVKPAVGNKTQVAAVAVGHFGVGPVVTAARRRGDAQFVPPRYEIYGTKSGDDVLIRVEIDDPSLSINGNTKVQFDALDGSDQTWDGLVSSWDTVTGTAGASTALTRLETFAEPYTAMRLQITFRDEKGNEQDKGGVVNFSDIVTMTQKMVLPGGSFQPQYDGDAHRRYNYGSGEGLVYQVPSNLVPSTGDNYTFYGHFTIPDGSVLTSVKVRGRKPATHTLSGTVYNDETSFGSLGGYGTAMGDATASGSVTASTGESFTIHMACGVPGSTVTDGPTVGRTIITYEVPSWLQNG